MKATPSLAIPPAIQAERDRQVSGEGYDARHDDDHVNGELLAVARMYYQRAIGVALQTRQERVLTRRGLTPLHDEWRYRSIPVGFPWDGRWWKPKTARRDIERAGALCLAERDRLLRAGSALGDRSISVVEEQLAVIVSAYHALAS